MNEEVKITFVIPKNCRNDDECSEDMQAAYVACEQHKGSGLQVKWVHESQMKSFEGITKKDVFVLSEFEGDIYDKLKNTSCLLVGPRCLLCCLTEGIEIPAGPVYTVAMRNLLVTASGLSAEKKEFIQKRVQWMGGVYKTVLTDATTHLISNTVVSEKYNKAVEIGIPIMSESWVEAVWQASLELNVNGASSDFDCHRLPAFANLEVTTSSILKKDKQLIMKLVTENGGKFSGAFQSETTDVIVMTKEGIGSAKYKAAVEFGKACVLPAWVKDSTAKGVTLPFINYKVTGALTSSPLTEHRLPDMSLNFSRIPNSRPTSNFVDETRSTDVSTMSNVRMKVSHEKRKSEESIDNKDVQMAFENFDMNLIKKAGPIFDGFCIWLYGLDGAVRERCSACISRCGGVRYISVAGEPAPTARLTHAVASSISAGLTAKRAVPGVPVLSPLWVLRSVECGRPLDEAEFIIDVNPKTPAKTNSTRKQPMEIDSPMSKRNLQLLRREPLNLPPPPILEEVQDELVNHYLSQNTRTPPKAKTPEPPAETSPKHNQPDVDDPTEEIEQIFKGLKLEVQGLDEEAIIEIGAEVSAAGGVLAAAGSGGSHVLVPLDFDPQDLITEHAEPVTVFWVKDCLCEQELVPIQYYHRPVCVPQWSSAEPPLRGVVASLSTYTGVERIFLDELANLLGAKTQVRFCRRNTSNALASTHLICPSAVGDKYAGALKWGLPAVKASWLLECAKEGRRVSEKEHLVGDTKASPSPEESFKQVNEQTNERTNITTDKEEMAPPVEVNVPRRSFPNVNNTPKPISIDDGDEMSPASRYIAMARQGLLGGDSQETPKRVDQLNENNQPGAETIRTPPIEDALSTPNLAGLSPTMRRRLQAVRRGEMPSDPIRTPVNPFERDDATPDSDFGGALRPGSGRLSPDNRKRLWKFVNDLPSKPEPVTDNKDTPLSEVRNRFLAQFAGEPSTGTLEHMVAPRKLDLQDLSDTPPPAKIAKRNENQFAGRLENKSGDKESTSSGSSAAASIVDVQLQRLDAALAGRLSSQRPRRSTRDSFPAPLSIEHESETGPLSQPNTVGWDDTHHQVMPVQKKKFMLSSNVDNRMEIAEMIKYLGGEVSESIELDTEATHLLCSTPGRSEKMLGSIATGKWVLHPSYVARSRQAGSFLSEEEFEWGNPLATSLPGVAGPDRVLTKAAHRWRINRRDGLPGPFAGMTALLHMIPSKKRMLSRLIIAGDGQVLDDEPPYSVENVTACFADVKRYPLSDQDAQWFRDHRIPVCAPVLISSFLTDDESPKPEQHCLPDYRPT